MKNGLFKKFYITTVVSVAICFSLLMLLTYALSSSHLSNEKQELLSKNCRIISSTTTNIVGTANFRQYVLSVISVLSSSIDADVFVTDINGNTFVCSCAEWNNKSYCSHAQSKIPEKILKKALTSEYYECGNFQGRYKQIHYTYGCPIYNPAGEEIGTVFASSQASNQRVYLNGFIKIFFLCSAVALVFLLIMVYAVTSRFVRPLKLMSQAAKKMAQGDFSQRIVVDSNDEVGELANAFNDMTNALVKIEGTRRSFIANVSHELRTPMTTIGGFIDGIIDGTIEKDKHEYYLSIVSAEVKRLTALVYSMLSLASLESGEMKPNLETVDIHNVICATLISQEQRIERQSISIEGIDSVDEVKVIADSGLIHQVMYNLIDNAIKFTLPGGYIAFGFEKTEKYAKITIRNSGEGIKNEDLPFVFERFYKGDKSRSVNKNSTGLGLYIVKTIVEINNGTVSVASKVGEYTEFTVSLLLA